jgi:hypothetical protein
MVYNYNSTDMKRVYIVILLCSASMFSQGQTPNFNEWFSQKKTQIKYLTEQIAALKVYLKYLKKGYDVAQKGLTTIAAIKEGSFSQHKNYFASLKAVSPVVKNSVKITMILELQPRMLDDFKTLLNDVRGETSLTEAEKKYIADVYQQLLQAGNASIDELDIITTAGQAEMKDDERLLRLDKVYEDILGQYTFTQSFIATARGLSMSRTQDKSQVKSLEKLYSDL